MDSTTKARVENYIKSVLKEKLETYEALEDYNPFLTNIIPSNYVELRSFIHSISTFFGMSIYVQISKIIAESNGFINCKAIDLYNSTTLSDAQINKIEEIIDRLNDPTNKSNFESETEELLSVDASSGKNISGDTKIRLSIEKDDIQYLILIKSAKPNLGELKTFKRKLLKWRSRLKRTDIRTLLVYPFNPFYPKEYKHFVTKNFFEKGKELLIGEEYWDFIGGKHTFENLKEIFENVGNEFSDLINSKIKNIISN